MSLAFVLYINDDVVQVNNDKDIQLCGQDFIDITLEASRYIGETKKHDLVLKMTVLSLKNRLPFITFRDSHPMIGAGGV